MGLLGENEKDGWMDEGSTGAFEVMLYSPITIAVPVVVARKVVAPRDAIVHELERLVHASKQIICLYAHITGHIQLTKGVKAFKV